MIPQAFKGVVRDPIHGFIPYTYSEDELMQSPFLRRLHSVKQLGLSNLVFPGATHSRFSHSLGTMHISSMFAEKIIKQSMESSLCKLLYRKCDEAPKYFFEIARLTGLLHDLGHLPFSHQLEESFAIIANKATWARRVEESFIPGETLDEISKAINRLDESALHGLKFHEAFTQVFIEKLRENARSEQLRYELCVVRGALNPEYKEAIDCGEYLYISGDAIRVLHDIISHDIADADRLDYLERDGTMTGVVYGKIDTARLLQGVDLKIIDESPQIIISQRGLSSLEDIFDARYKMYKNVYHHHKVKAINLALTRATELLFTFWETTASPQLLRHIETPAVLFDAESVANLIIEGKFYFTDNEFMALFANLANNDGKTSDEAVASRWARALLERRDLLPISLLKRPDELHTLIASKVADSETATEFTDKIIDNIASSEKKIVLKDRILKFIESRSRGISEEDIRLEFDQVRIFDKDRLEKLGIYHSLYLKALASVSSVRLLFAFVMSDDERIHRVLYTERVGLRRVFFDFVEEIINEEIRR